MPDIFNTLSDTLQEFWPLLKAIFSFLGDISLFFVAIVTFYKTTYCKTIKISSIRHHSTKDDALIITFKIISRSLVSLIITNIEWIIDDTWKVTLLKQDEDAPLELPSMGICDTSTKPYSTMKQEDEFRSATHSKKWYMLITFSDGTVKKVRWKYRNIIFRWHYKRLRNKHLSLKSPSVIIYRHEPSGLLINPHVRYIVNMTTIDSSCWFKIYDSGVMKHTIGGYNGLPQDVMSNKDLVLETLQQLDVNAKYEIHVIDKSVFSNYLEEPTDKKL